MVDRKIEIKRILNERFILAVQTIMNNGGGKRITQKEVAERLEEYPNVISELLNGTKNVSLPQLGRLVNEFDVNANYLVKYDNSNEELFYSINIEDNSDNRKFGDILVEHNEVSGGTGIVQGDVYNIDQLMQNAPDELKEYIKNVERKTERLDGEISGLKKANTILESQLKESNQMIRDKDQRLFEAQQELIKIYRDGASKS